ncbi:MAG TPA: peptidyl-prolyl cis-trans isomerase [Fervidobacterium nodosum]|nr:peptidyl-prolyl cis-trans isomerase [Fervidobacterium nodosum]
MSKESKDVKVRKTIKRWQEIFIWIVAIAFVAGIALWALAVNYAPGAKKVKRTIEETVGYLTISGEPSKDQSYWVFPEEVEQKYGDLLAAYGNPQIDPVIEEPYVKTLIAVDFLNNKAMLYYAKVNDIKADKKKLDEEVKKEMDNIKKDQAKSQQIKAQYGSLSNYEKEFRKNKEQELIISAVKEKLGAISEDEIKKYYNENKNDIVQKYTKAEVEYATFNSKDEMENFVKLATEKGVTQAASELSVTLSPYTLQKGTLPEELEKEIFDATSTLVSLPYNNSFFVFNVKSVQKADTYENFVKTDGYTEVRNELTNKKFSDNFKKWKDENKVSFELRDPVYKAWYKALSSENKDLLTVYKEFYEQLFNENGEVRTDVANEQKAAFLVVADRIVESTDTALEKVKEDVKGFERKIVSSIYEATKGSSKEILRRMKEYNPENKQIAFDYYSKLYDEIKPYLSIGGAYYVMNQLFEVYQGFADLADSTSTELNIRADSIYKLYDMNKMLDEPKVAKQYLTKLKEIKPDYSLDFEKAEKELDEIIKQQEASQQSTNTTNEGTNTGK